LWACLVRGADEESRLFDVPKVLGSIVERVLEDRRAELGDPLQRPGVDCRPAVIRAGETRSPLSPRPPWQRLPATICGSERSANSSDWVSPVFMVAIGAFP
jgi:hypothetical protein